MAGGLLAFSERKTLLSRRHDTGFTIVEFMVAGVIVTVALTGIYAFFRETMECESRVSVRWHDRGTARVIAGHLAKALEQAVNLPEVPAVVVESDGNDGKQTLTCVVDSGARSVGGAYGGLERRRYRWDFPEDDERAGTLELQTMIYGGTRNLELIRGLDELPAEEVWNRLPITVIGRRLEDLVVTCSTLSGSQSKSSEHQDGHVGDVLISVRVTVGAETIERSVVPQVNAVISSYTQ